MGALIEIAGIEVNAIDALLYVWLVLARVSTVYVVWDQFVPRRSPFNGGELRLAE